MIDDISHLFPALNVETNYRVVYRGKLLEGHQSSSVATALKDQFRMSDEQISAFLSKKKFIVRKDMPRANAARLRAKLRKAGLDVVANSRKAHHQKIEPQQTLSEIPQSEQQQDQHQHHNQRQNQTQIRNPTTTRAPQSVLRRATESEPAPKSANSRWIIIGMCSLFTLGVIWMFFSI